MLEVKVFDDDPAKCSRTAGNDAEMLQTPFGAVANVCRSVPKLALIRYMLRAARCISVSPAPVPVPDSQRTLPAHLGADRVHAAGHPGDT